MNPGVSVDVATLLSKDFKEMLEYLKPALKKALAIKSKGGLMRDADTEVTYPYSHTNFLNSQTRTSGIGSNWRSFKRHANDKQNC